MTTIIFKWLEFVQILDFITFKEMDIVLRIGYNRFATSFTKPFVAEFVCVHFE